MPLRQQVAAKGLFRNSDSAILVLKRAKPYHGETVLRWDIPGGRADPGESLEDALARELKEETGLTLQAAKVLVDHQDFQVPGADIQVYRFTFEAILEAEKPINLSHEHEEYAWRQPADLNPDDTAWQLIETLKVVEG